MGRLGGGQHAAVGVEHEGVEVAVRVVLFSFFSRHLGHLLIDVRGSLDDVLRGAVLADARGGDARSTDSVRACILSRPVNTTRAAAFCPRSSSSVFERAVMIARALFCGAARLRDGVAEKHSTRLQWVASTMQSPGQRHAQTASTLVILKRVREWVLFALFAPTSPTNATDLAHYYRQAVAARCRGRRAACRRWPRRCCGVADLY